MLGGYGMGIKFDGNPKIGNLGSKISIISTFWGFSFVETSLKSKIFYLLDRNST